MINLDPCLRAANLTPELQMTVVRKTTVGMRPTLDLGPR